MDYRVNWTVHNASYPTWTDLSGNAFPTGNSYTITGLDHGTLYKVRVRARYDGPAGPWTGDTEALVMDHVVQEVNNQPPQNEPPPPATNTLVPPATNTLAPPPATNTRVPPTATNPPPTATIAVTIGVTQPAQTNRLIGMVAMASNNSGEIRLSWSVPSEAPVDYRVMFAPVGESYKTWSDSSGNAFPTSPSATLTGLQAGQRYKLKIRARYGGSSGAWSPEYEINVAG